MRARRMFEDRAASAETRPTSLGEDVEGSERPAWAETFRPPCLCLERFFERDCVPFETSFRAGRRYGTFLLRAEFCRRHASFRGVEELPKEVNKIVYSALDARVRVSLVLDASRPDYPFAPPVWDGLSVCSTRPDLPFRQCLEQAVSRENATLVQGWSPALSATCVLSLLARMRADVAAVLREEHVFTSLHTDGSCEEASVHS